MNNRASKRQKELLNFIDSFIQGNGYGPSYREVMRALGYKSVSTVAVHVDGLMKKGYLRKRDHSARSLEVVTTHLNVTPERKTATPAQEKWLINFISAKFEEIEKTHDPKTLDELYVMTGALKILELDGAHVAMKTRLMDYIKAQSSGSNKL
jgi:repressor LexA